MAGGLEVTVKMDNEIKEALHKLRVQHTKEYLERKALETSNNVLKGKVEILSGQIEKLKEVIELQNTAIASLEVKLFETESALAEIYDGEW